MARVTAEEFADKHARRLKGATEDIRLGVQRVTVAPTELAAKKKDKMKVKLNEAIDSGRWERGLRKVSREEWQTKIINKGIPRISQGIDEARPKVVEFASQLLPHVDAGVAKINSMPDLTLDDSIQRMSTFVRHMAGFKKK